MKRRFASLLPLFFTAYLVVGCNPTFLLPGAQPSATLVPNSLVYDAPVSLTVRNGTTLPATTIGYAGKNPTGSAKMLIGKEVAIKQIGDSLDWQGVPVPNTVLKLTTRLVSFDDQNATLVGTAHLEITNVKFQPGGAVPATGLELSAPVTYSIAKPGIIPGTNVTYIGSTEQGAQFGGITGYPYRKQLDSLEQFGRVNPKVFVKLNLRVLNYSDAGTLLGGTADIKIEP